jgi:hypothetical protein
MTFLGNRRILLSTMKAVDFENVVEWDELDSLPTQYIFKLYEQQLRLNVEDVTVNMFWVPFVDLLDACLKEADKGVMVEMKPPYNLLSEGQEWWKQTTHWRKLAEFFFEHKRVRLSHPMFHKEMHAMDSLGHSSLYRGRLDYHPLFTTQKIGFGSTLAFQTSFSDYIISAGSGFFLAEHKGRDETSKIKIWEEYLSIIRDWPKPATFREAKTLAKELQ